MKLTLFTVSIVLAAFASVSASAGDTYKTLINENAGFFDIREVKIEKVEVREMKVTSRLLRDYQNDCSTMKRDLESRVATPHSASQFNSEPPGDSSHKTSSSQPNSTVPGVGSSGDFSLDQIMNIGKQVWEILQANKPVVTTQTFYAHALPRGIQCWDELESWNRPRSEVYRATYYNGFGFEVVNLEFRLMYNYGGQVNGVGNYISNATIQYGKLDVFWGFKVDASVEVPLVVNVGKSANPVAGMQMSVRWKVNGLNHIERTASFFLYGDGRPTEVMN